MVFIVKPIKNFFKGNLTVSHKSNVFSDWTAEKEKENK